MTTATTDEPTTRLEEEDDDRHWRRRNWPWLVGLVLAFFCGWAIAHFAFQKSHPAQHGVQSNDNTPGVFLPDGQPYHPSPGKFSGPGGAGVQNLALPAQSQSGSNYGGGNPQFEPGTLKHSTRP
jgi:hypothetical protein